MYINNKIVASDTQIKISQDDLNLNGAPTGVGNGDVAALLNAVYIVAGIVAVIAIVVGGVRYVVSNGDAAGVKSAKNTIMYAVAGLIVVIAASAITDFVIKNVAK